MDIFTVHLLLAVIFFLPSIYRLLLKFICWSCKRAINLDVEIKGLGFLSLRGIKIFLPQHTLDIGTLNLLLPGGGREKFRICVHGLSVVKNARAPAISSSCNDVCQKEVMLLTSCQLENIRKWFELEILDLSLKSELAGQRSLHLSTSKVVLHLNHNVGNQLVVANVNLYSTTLAMYSDPLGSEFSACRRDELASKHKLALQWNTYIKAVASLTEDGVSLEKLSVDIHGLDVEIKETLSNLIVGKCHPVKAAQRTMHTQSIPEKSLEYIIHRFSPLIPKDFHFGIHDIEVSGMKGSLSPYTVSIHNCSFDLSDIMAHPGNQDSALNPQLSIALCISNVEMDINLLDAVKIESFSVAGNLKNKVLNSDAMLKSVAVVYHHEELMKWLKINFQKLSFNEVNQPSRRENTSQVDGLTSINRGAILLRNSQNNSNNSSTENKFVKWLSAASVIVQMSRLTGKYFLSPREPAEALSFDLDYVRLKYEKSQGSNSGPLAFNEVILRNLWCHQGRMPFDQIYRKDKYHTWGTPLFFSLLKLENPEPRSSNPRPVEVLLSSVQMEWTPSLPSVALRALWCFLDFQKAVSDLVFQKVRNEMPNGWSTCRQSNSMNLTVLDCNVFLMDDLAAKHQKKEDLCYMLRFDTTEYRSLPLLFSCDVEGFKAITILQNRAGQYACAKSKDLQGYWLYVKRLKGISHNPFGEITVNLKEEVKLFWNQELHSRVATMLTDLQHFWKSLCETYHHRQSRSSRNAGEAWSLTINSDCPAKVVVDLFNSATTVHILFSEATYISTDRERCIKAYIRQATFLQGALLGLNTASVCAFWNDFPKGYIYHEKSKTSLYISLDQKLKEDIMENGYQHDFIVFQQRQLVKMVVFLHEVSMAYHQTGINFYNYV